MTVNQIILYELNEVPDIIFSRFREKSNKFGRLIDKFTYYKTISLDNVPLSPWITWSTVHRGVTYEKHQIKNLGQDIRSQNELYPLVWTDLKNKEFDVGVYGSMHSNVLPLNYKDYKFYVPDPFSDHSKCEPETLEPIQDFQLKLTRQSSRNVKRSFSNELSLKLVFGLLKSGIKLKTYLKLIKQLIHEKIDKFKTNRRRVFQSILNFDIYYSLLKLHSPDFSCFFTNHVASAMHRYWEASYPEDFKGNNKQDETWINSYKNEIDYAMDVAASQLDSLIKYATNKPNCEIWVCTSMGQAPVLDYTPVKSQLYVMKPKELIQSIGLNPDLFEIMPAMMPRWTFKSENKNINDLSNALKRLTLDKRPIEQMLYESSLTIKINHINKMPHIELDNVQIDINKVGLEMVNIEDNSGSSAYHIPEGVLLIYGSDSNRYLDHGVIPTHNIKDLISSSLEKR
tara:strand:- start:3534 stop:4898 length:1365 start_codon:yes stop_codon:yes gene_type:complete